MSKWTAHKVAPRTRLVGLEPAAYITSGTSKEPGNRVVAAVFHHDGEYPELVAQKIADLHNRAEPRIEQWKPDPEPGEFRLDADTVRRLTEGLAYIAQVHGHSDAIEGIRSMAEKLQGLLPDFDHPPEQAKYMPPCLSLNPGDGAECGRANVPTTARPNEVKCPECRAMIGDMTDARRARQQEAMHAPGTTRLEQAVQSMRPDSATCPFQPTCSPSPEAQAATQDADVRPDPFEPQ